MGTQDDNDPIRARIGVANIPGSMIAPMPSGRRDANMRVSAGIMPTANQGRMDLQDIHLNASSGLSYQVAGADGHIGLQNFWSEYQQSGQASGQANQLAFKPYVTVEKRIDTVPGLSVAGGAVLNTASVLHMQPVYNANPTIPVPDTQIVGDLRNTSQTYAQTFDHWAAERYGATDRGPGYYASRSATIETPTLSVPLLAKYRHDLSDRLSTTAYGGLQADLYTRHDTHLTLRPVLGAAVSAHIGDKLTATAYAHLMPSVGTRAQTAESVAQMSRDHIAPAMLETDRRVTETLEPNYRAHYANPPAGLNTSATGRLETAMENPGNTTILGIAEDAKRKALQATGNLGAHLHYQASPRIGIGAGVSLPLVAATQNSVEHNAHATPSDSPTFVDRARDIGFQNSILQQAQFEVNATISLGSVSSAIKNMTKCDNPGRKNN